MHQAIRNGLVSVGWCALLVLLGTGVFLVRAGADGWATETSASYRAEDGVHVDSVEYRITPHRIRRLTSKDLRTTGYVRDLERYKRIRFPGVGEVRHNSNTGFLPESYDLNRFRLSAPPQHPDEIAGWPAVGIGRETFYREIRDPKDNNDVLITGQLEIWYCWTLWPALVILTLSLPALHQVWSALAFVRRASRNQKSHLHGLCPGCGYDIRATPERCPECGRTQYAPNKERVSFVRRITWLFGLGLLLPAAAMLGIGKLWEILQPDSYLRDGIFYPAMRWFFVAYGLAILLWAIRHFIADLCELIQVYGE